MLFALEMDWTASIILPMVPCRKRKMPLPDKMYFQDMVDIPTKKDKIWKAAIRQGNIFVEEKWGVFAVPTKEGRIFAGKTDDLVYTFDNQEDALESAKNETYYDELISHYTVKLIGV